MAEAFAKAKNQAGELAEAAGAKLGTLQSLSRQSYARPIFESSVSVCPTYPMVSLVGPTENETLVSQPNETEFRIQIQAQFRIE